MGAIHSQAEQFDKINHMSVVPVENEASPSYPQEPTQWLGFSISNENQKFILLTHSDYSNYFTWPGTVFYL